MGKWAARLAEKAAVPLHPGTDKAAKRGVLSVLAVTPEGGGRNFRAAPMEARELADLPAPLDLAPVAWTDADIARFLDRRARLLRWGWAEAEAEKLADRLVTRDREGGDDRVSCAGDCSHYRPGRCGNHRRAGLQAPDMGRDLASLLQRCPGFNQREGGR